jgi:stage II sporulation protein D
VVKARPVRAALGLLAVLTLAGSVPASDDDQRIRQLAGKAGQREPMLRIGLAHAHRVEVSGSRGFKLLDPADGKPLWKPRFEEPLQVVAEGGPRDGVASVFRIQVGAFGAAEVAQRELERLEAMTGASGIVHHDPDRGNYRVRLGLADDRLALSQLMEELRQAGLQGLWIAEEPAAAAGDVALRLVDGSYQSFATGLTRVVLVPEGQGRVSVGGRAYRGVVELRISPYGTVRPINWVDLEQYLLGVVPAELGPEVWPELAALRAQSVAARTYAWRNKGQFNDEGFDLCDTPRCQVYKGASAEHSLSDRAVQSTKGEVLAYEGQPIVALYTSTCGGHTEDGKEIFPEHNEPYLKGVPCRAESDAVGTLGRALEGREVATVVDETGADVTRDWALLSAAGIVSGPPGTAVEAARLQGWTAALAARAGLPAPASAAGAAELDPAAAARTLLTDLGWAERARVLLASEDLPALLRDPEAESLEPEARRALAYLADMEAIRPYPSGGFGVGRAVTGARLAPALVRIGESYSAFGLQEGTVAEVGESDLRLVRGKGALRLPVAPDVTLIGRTAGRAVPARKLALWPGDAVRYRTNGAGAIDLLELKPPVKGTSDDRSSKVYSWEVRKTRRQLEAVINARVAVGELRDLTVVRRGVSGRIVELRVIGSSGEALVRGFDVRRLLDLRESLLVIEPQRDAAGRLEAVVFAGKGWGHGVGLCQVGAYGMALRGADYKAILAHYYRGSKLDRLRPVSR